MRTEMKDDDYIPELPELSGYEHVMSYFFSVGPVLSGGNGPAPLTHLEIRAWQENTGNCLNGWEANLLKTLSIEYLAEFDAAKSPGAVAPFTAPLQINERADLAKRVRLQFSAMMSGAKGKA